MGTSVMAMGSTFTNQGFRFHEPDSSTCSCRPRVPPASMNACPLWKSSCPGTTGPARSPGVMGRPSMVVMMPTWSESISSTCSSRPEVPNALALRVVTTWKSAGLMR